MPRIESRFKEPIAARPAEWRAFGARLEGHWEALFAELNGLYGWQYDFFYTLEQVLALMADSWLARPADLKALDASREAAPQWFCGQQMVGGVLYVDLFSDRLARLHEHIPYFKKLGLTYLHLMPLFAVPHEDNDGGYAVSDYRAVNPDIGTMAELAALARILRSEGISLALDFVLNHTSDEHAWVRQARAGDPEYRDFYHTFPDRHLPDLYQAHLREIFPTVRRGSFTWDEDLGRWVWTTFNSFQWDLNYGNPKVFRAMAEEMLFLANQGVEVLRLDAVAFIWKQMGTDCENRPEAHRIVRAYNRMARIAAPALLFKSEAIVHPEEVLRYIGTDECRLSYNPQLMALLWEAAATREVRLLVHAMRRRGRIPEGCSWVNYLRCHDDIGWTFDDEDARSLGIDPSAHRRFLNDFYTGHHPASFAVGVSFQFNPDNQDQRICGTLASLAGLEQALETRDGARLETAVRRINLLRSILLSIGGIPLIYLGDEWGQLNDYTYLSDPKRATDSRWVHRSRRRWEDREDMSHPDALEWRFFQEMVGLIRLRQGLPAFQNGGMTVVETGNPHLFGFLRRHEDQRILVVNNFAETSQRMRAEDLAACGVASARDLLTERRLEAGMDLELDGCQFAWIEFDSPHSTTIVFDRPPA